VCIDDDGRGKTFFALKYMLTKFSRTEHYHFNAFFRFMASKSRSFFSTVHKMCMGNNKVVVVIVKITF